LRPSKGGRVLLGLLIPLLAVDASGEAGDMDRPPGKRRRRHPGRDGKMAELSVGDAGASMTGTVIGRLSPETPGKGAAGAGKTPAAERQVREVTMNDGERSRAILGPVRPLSSTVTR
jgi:hypothetical protein